MCGKVPSKQGLHTWMVRWIDTMSLETGIKSQRCHLFLLSSLGKLGFVECTCAHEGWVSFWFPLISNHNKEPPLGYLLHWYCLLLKTFPLSSSPSLCNAWNNFSYHEIWEKVSAKRRKRSNKMRNMFIPIMSQRYLGKGLSPMSSIIALGKTQHSI